MSDMEKKAMDNANGLEAVSDDELDAVAGGASAEKCPHQGRYKESEFPEKGCKNCPKFRSYKGDLFKWHMFCCDHFNRNEKIRFDVWGFFD